MRLVSFHSLATTDADKMWQVSLDPSELHRLFEDPEVVVSEVEGGPELDEDYSFVIRDVAGPIRLLGLDGSGVLILELPFADESLPSTHFFDAVTGANLVMSTDINVSDDQPLATAIHLKMGDSIRAQSALMVAAIRYRSALSAFLSDMPVSETLKPVDAGTRQRAGADVGPIDRSNAVLPNSVTIAIAKQPTLYCMGKLSQKICPRCAASSAKSFVHGNIRGENAQMTYLTDVFGLKGCN
jgi:hypothetical protein